MVIPLPEVPPQLPVDTPPKVVRNLRYIRILVWSLLLCCSGRFFAYDTMGALNDGFSFVFGICLLGEKALCGCHSTCCRLSLDEWGGFSCLLPYCLICAVNATFDLIQLPQLNDTCKAFFTSPVNDGFQMLMCSRSLFIFAATVLQFLGTLLAWDSYKQIRPILRSQYNPFWIPPESWDGQYTQVTATDPERGAAALPALRNGADLHRPLTEPGGTQQGNIEFVPFQGRGHNLED